MHGQFEEKIKKSLPEIGIELTEAVHKKTGAKILHLGCDDVENVFCLSFQTCPSDSKGVAHILEHTVLCGSKKYPVRDPFFSMMRRSLNTFMNAFTGSDFTCYPASSQIKKDLYNLLDVYCDAVFFPLLNKNNFLQEGWRLDLEEPPTFKGIVFNEMKGAMATPESRLAEGINQALFPGITYANNSGGDPAHITELTYEELIAFHQTYYHPSRCLFYFYGNIPLDEHLSHLEETLLSKVSPLPPLAKIPSVKRLKQPIETAVPFPESKNNEDIVSINWLTVSVEDQQTVLALNILLEVLFGTDAAPLKSALLKSGLVESAACHLDSDINEVPISLILKGCGQGHGKQIETFVLNTLQHILKEGIHREAIERAIHQLEFHRSEITHPGHPYGLSLFLRSALLLQHGVRPENALQIHSLCKFLREQPIDYYHQLLQTHLIDNPHRALVVAFPDPTLEEREIKEEKKRLQTLVNTLSQEKKEELIAEAKTLDAFQQSDDDTDLSILPKLALNDVPKDIKTFPLKEKKHAEFTVYTHEAFTNEITYLDFVVPLPEVAESDLPSLNLFAYLLSQIGSKNASYEEILQKIQATTGGISATLSLFHNTRDPHAFNPALILQGKALKHNTHHLFNTMYHMLTSPNFKEKERLEELIKKHLRGLESSLVQRSMGYASTLASSHLDIPSRLSEAWGGIEYLQWMRKVSQMPHQALTQQLETIAQKLLTSLDIVITADQATLDFCEENHYFAASAWRKKTATQWSQPISLGKRENMGCMIPAPVAFTSATLPSAPYTSPNAPALSIASELFDRLTLHPKIREQGGAYGGGSHFTPMQGKFSFFAYRSPTIANTLDAFQEAVSTILEGNFSEEELEEAKLEVLQGIDSPVSPGERGEVAYHWMRENKTDALRTKYRNAILSLKKEEVIKSVKEEIAPKLSSLRIVSFAGEELFNRENAELGLKLSTF